MPERGRSKVLPAIELPLGRDKGIPASGSKAVALDHTLIVDCPWRKCCFMDDTSPRSVLSEREHRSHGPLLLVDATMLKSRLFLHTPSISWLKASVDRKMPSCRISTHLGCHVGSGGFSDSDIEVNGLGESIQ